MVAHGAAPSTTMTPTSVRFTRSVHAIAMLHLVAMLDVGGLDVGGGSGGMFGIGGTQQHSSYEVLVGSPVEKEGAGRRSPRWALGCVLHRCVAVGASACLGLTECYRFS